MTNDSQKPLGTPSRPAARAAASIPAKNARSAALRVLADLREGRKTARESIDGLISRAQLPSREVGLATELVMGVIRRRLTLGKVLGTYAVHGWQRVGRQLQHVLMLGAYQIIWMDSIPPFAAVNEAVKQARYEGGVRAGRFVNAILRQLLRDIEHHRLPRRQCDPVRALPLDEELALQLRRPVLTDPATNPTAWLAEATSHPAWLVGRWIDHYGRQAAERICYSGMRRPTVMLRPNQLKTDASRLAGRLRDEGFSVETTPRGFLAFQGNMADLMRSSSFAEGYFQPQDPTSAKPAVQMAPAADGTVIDLCAGAGTKSTQIAELMSDRGRILATDKDPHRLRLLENNCRRLGIRSIRVIPLDQLPAAAGESGRIDWVLVDAPCGNTGVLSRRPEARYRVDERALKALADIQTALLDAAAGLAGSGTQIMYSTCSLEPEENEAVCEAFAKRHPGWALAASELTLPNSSGPFSTWCDGGFWAAWRRV